MWSGARGVEGGRAGWAWLGLRVRRRGLSFGWGCVGAASSSSGAAPARLLVQVGLRWCGFDSSCAPKGPRPGSWQRGGSVLGLRLAVGARICVGAGHRWIRHFLSALQVADPPPSGSGEAGLLPSRGPCHEKGEALPTSDPLAVDLPPLERSEGGRSTDGTRKRRILAPTASHSPRTGAAAPPSRPVEALSERRTSRSRADAAPPRVEAAQTQPHPESKSRQHSRRSSPTRNDAAAGQASRADDVRRPGPAAARPGGGRSPCAGRR